MGKDQEYQVSDFTLEGRFLNYIVENGYKLKYIRLTTAEGECRIKLSKAARGSLGRVLTPGDWIEVSGRKKVSRRTGESKLKALIVTPIAPRPLPLPPVEPVVLPQPTQVPAKASVLVCQKSHCMKRGGKAACQALAASLSERGLDDQVAIKMTGCMNRCKAAPNIVFMPDKARYSRVSPDEIPALVDRHFPTDSPAEQPAEPIPTIPLPEPLPVG